MKDLSRDIREKLLPILPRDIGTVYGIPRSGMIPASIIATAIGAKLGILGGPSFVGARQKNFAFTEGDKALVVDDSIHHGRAIAAARADMEELAAGYYTCAVYGHPGSVHLVDFCAEIIQDRRIFEWNFSGIQAAGRFCWSLEGVICTWPDRCAGGSEESYSAKPLYLPQIRVRAIVAERGERWRGDTQTWLTRFGVTYDELIMLPDANDIRRTPLSPAEFKAKCLVETGCELLVEGRDSVAETVARAAGRQVLSLESMKLY